MRSATPNVDSRPRPPPEDPHFRADARIDRSIDRSIGISRRFRYELLRGLSLTSSLAKRSCQGAVPTV